MLTNNLQVQFTCAESRMVKCRSCWETIDPVVGPVLIHRCAIKQEFCFPCLVRWVIVQIVEGKSPTCPRCHHAQLSPIDIQIILIHHPDIYQRYQELNQIVVPFERIYLNRERNEQSCPHCGIIIAKIEGCNHITCYCRHEFCWICRKRYTADHYYDIETKCYGRHFEFDAFFEGIYWYIKGDVLQLVSNRGADHGFRRGQLVRVIKRNGGKGKNYGNPQYVVCLLKDWPLGQMTPVDGPRFAPVQRSLVRPLLM